MLTHYKKGMDPDLNYVQTPGKILRTKNSLLIHTDNLHKSSAKHHNRKYKIRVQVVENQHHSSL